MALSDADRIHHWHGFTQMSSYESILVDHADGCWLYTTDGRTLLDGVSSLWCNLHGHRHAKIDAAIREQLDRVAHCTNIGMGCTTTATLAARLAKISPGDLNHVFFSSDGASAVEVAIKMALQYWRQSGIAGGENKTRYLALGSAYHGDTVGTVSLGDIPHFHRVFDPLLFDVLRGPCPDTYRLPPHISPAGALDYYAKQFESILNQHAAVLAAIVIEPLIQGAAGLIRHPAGLLQRLRDLCDHYDVLLIADEIATGFGRTGKMFACDHEQVVPDILCLGKGLTGGYLPMAATIARGKVFDAFLGEDNASRQLFHGHTYSGNPLAAAAAIASLDLFTDGKLLAKVNKTAERLMQLIEPLRDHCHVGEIRQLGLMVGIELVKDKQTKEPFESSLQTGRRVCDESTARGVWIRPLGDVVVLMPPLCIASELDMLVSTVADSINHCVSGPRQARLNKSCFADV